MDDQNPAMEMPRYVSHKKVWALEISEVVGVVGTARRQLLFRDPGYDPILADGEMFLRYEPVAGDFYVVYADGYKSFSPRKAFLEGYMPETIGTGMADDPVVRSESERGGG